MLKQGQTPSTLPERRRAEDKENASSNGGEDLQRLQSMIMELNSSKSKAAQAAAQLAVGEMNSTICRVCNKDMENKYFLRAHMMNEHGILHMEEPPQLPIRPDESLLRAREPEDLPNGIESSQDFPPSFSYLTFTSATCNNNERSYLSYFLC